MKSKPHRIIPHINGVPIALMTTAQVFRYCVEAVEKQGHASFRNDIHMCSYRGPGNDKCAIGFLLNDTDAQYVEERSWPCPSFAWVPYNEPHDGIRCQTGFEHYELLNELQSAHDDQASDLDDETFIRYWRQKTQSIARRFNIVWK